MTGEMNRRMSILKALRKRRITKEVYWWYREHPDSNYYDNLHQYSKNKIHCSCPKCSPKTRYGRIDKVSDMRKIQRLEYVD